MLDWIQSDFLREWSGRATAVLLDGGVKGYVLLALACLAAFALRRASAAARNLVWALALGGLLLLPALSLVMPRWQMPISARPFLPVRLSITFSGSGGGAGVAPAPPALASRPASKSATPPAPASVALRVGSPMYGPSIPGAFKSLPLSLWVALAWLAGALAILAPLAAGALSVGRLAKKAEPLDDAAWSRLVRAASEALGLRRNVRLLRTGDAVMPMAAGILRPVILLPRESKDWPEKKRRSVLLHELAHVKRHDCLTHALARVALALHWFNPLAWLAFRRLRIERERACDDQALGAGSHPSEYADHLLDVARTMHPAARSASAAISMACRSQFEGRLLSILDDSKNHRAVSWKSAALAALASLCVIISIAAAEFRPISESGKSEADRLRAVGATNPAGPQVLSVPAKTMPDSSDGVPNSIREELLRPGPVDLETIRAFIRAVQEDAQLFNASGALSRPRPDSYAVSVSGKFLRRLGPDHRYAVPGFTALAKDPNPGVQRIAVIALYRIGEIPDELVPMLLDHLSKNQYLWAQDALILLGPKAKAGVPRLLQMMDDKRPWAKTVAANVLAAIGLPDAKPAIPAIEQYVKKTPVPGTDLCLSLLKLDPDSSVALEGLERTARDAASYLREEKNKRERRAQASNSTFSPSTLVASEDEGLAK